MALVSRRTHTARPIQGAQWVWGPARQHRAQRTRWALFRRSPRPCKLQLPAHGQQAFRRRDSPGPAKELRAEQAGELSLQVTLEPWSCRPRALCLSSQRSRRRIGPEPSKRSQARNNKIEWELPSARDPHTPEPLPMPSRRIHKCLGGAPSLALSASHPGQKNPETPELRHMPSMRSTISRGERPAWHGPRAPRVRKTPTLPRSPCACPAGAPPARAWSAHLGPVAPPPPPPPPRGSERPQDALRAPAHAQQALHQLARGGPSLGLSASHWELRVQGSERARDSLGAPAHAQQALDELARGGPRAGVHRQALVDEVNHVLRALLWRPGHAHAAPPRGLAQALGIRWSVPYPHCLHPVSEGASMQDERPVCFLAQTT